MVSEQFPPEVILENYWRSRLALLAFSVEIPRTHHPPNLLYPEVARIYSF
jgi:hypothetical protein